MEGKLTAICLLIMSILIFPPVSEASHPYKKEVLGESVAASDVSVPPVTAGPGFFLPDSPLYFLDTAAQKVKLVLAFTPEKKAEIHEQVAQERLAELRVMMAKNNSQGIKRALIELTKENASAADELKVASAKGKDVKDLAAKLNGSMKQQREFLNTASVQSKGALKMEFKAAKEDLKTAKVEVEDQLPEDELLKEVEDTLNDDIADDIEEASESAKGLEHSIDVLTKLASQAAQKEQLKREEALRRAIENKQEAIRRKEEKLLQLEKMKQEKLLQMKKETAETAREMTKKAQETAKKYEEAKKAEMELKNQTAGEEKGL